MRLHPMPVIMLSTLTQNGAAASIKALEIGAFDCVGKPLRDAMSPHAFGDLVEKVKAASRASIRARGNGSAIAAPAAGFQSDGRLLAIGSSTGGVEALLTILANFPANCPPTVITQHMPATFTKSFAERLNRCCAAEVAEAHDDAPLTEGKIYLAPGGAAHLEVMGSKHLRCRLRPSDLVNGHRPSVDVLFQSVVETVGGQSVGVILTGMGKDGARGLLAMRQAGASTLGQDEASSVVFGMPKAAYDIGAVERQLPLEKIGGAIVKLCNVNARENHAGRPVH